LLDAGIEALHVYVYVSWDAGINVHDVLPVTTPRSKRMMPQADRIYDAG